MRRLSLILTIPIAIIVVIFALTNRQVTEVKIWPLGIELAAPLFVLVLACGLIGFLVGAVVMWFSSGRHRRRRREAEWRVTDLERDLRDVKRSEAKPVANAARPGTSRIPSTELAEGPQRPAA